MKSVTIAENEDLIVAKARARTSIGCRLIPCGEAAFCYYLDERVKAIRLVVRSNLNKTLSANAHRNDADFFSKTPSFEIQPPGTLSWVALEDLYSTSIARYFALPALPKYSSFLRLLEWLTDLSITFNGFQP